MVILDTNIIIDHLRLKRTKRTLLEKMQRKHAKEILAVATITIQELYEGKSTLERHKEAGLLEVISGLKILPYTYEVARKAGEIARDSSYPLEFADAAIAACAIVNNASLYTLNRKDFLGIVDLELV